MQASWKMSVAQHHLKEPPMPIVILQLPAVKRKKLGRGNVAIAMEKLRDLLIRLSEHWDSLDW
jgi:hypothetical protein